MYFIPPSFFKHFSTHPKSATEVSYFCYRNNELMSLNYILFYFRFLNMLYKNTYIIYNKMKYGHSEC